MENATKALIIAGAMLIAIILIGTGIMLLKPVSDVEEQTGAVSENMAASAFNSQFTPYIGKARPAVQARSLASIVIANNSKSEHKVSMKIYLDGGGITTIAVDEVVNAFNYIKDRNYEISVEMNDGYITAVILK